MNIFEIFEIFEIFSKIFKIFRKILRFLRFFFQIYEIFHSDCAMCNFLPIRIFVQTKNPRSKNPSDETKKYENVSNPSEITPVDGILIKTHHPSILIVGVLTKKRVRHDGTYTNTTIG